MRTTQVQIVMPRHVNGNNRLFGGQLMEWIDVVAAVEARRHAGADVTLVAVDPLEFLAPVQLNEIVVIQAMVTWTGRTSIEVGVETFVEHRDGTRQLVNRAHLVFVAIDQAGKPVQVPPYVPDADETDERAEAMRRRELRLALRAASRPDSARPDSPDANPKHGGGV